MSDERTVWIVTHSDYDEYWIRGVYATEEAAKRVQTTRTRSGAVSRAVGAHSDRCCDIEEHEVQE